MLRSRPCICLYLCQGKLSSPPL